MGTLYDAFDLIKEKGKKQLINRIPDTPVRLKRILWRRPGHIL